MNGFLSNNGDGADSFVQTRSLDDPSGCLAFAIEHLETCSILHGDLSARAVKGLKTLAANLAPFQQAGFFRFLEFYNTAQRPSIAEAVTAYNRDLPPGFPAFTVELALRGIESIRTGVAA